MDFQRQSGGQGERVWHQAGDADGCAGNWKCATCGKTIDRLPFAPRADRLDTLKCRDCFRSSAPRGYGN